MTTFAEYQAVAGKVPVALRNNRDRIDLPALGLQEEAAKIGALLQSAIESGTFSLSPEQRSELKGKLSDILWFLALLCEETEVTLEEVATHSVARLRAKTAALDPERR